MGIAQEYSAWKRKQPDIACIFAGQIAMRPERYGQVIEIAGGAADNVAGLARNLARRIERLVGDRQAVAAAILFPQLNTLDRMAKVFLALDGLPLWSVATTALPDQGAGDYVAINISRTIPFGQLTCPSVALVLGPFAEFPSTRRAPTTGFEMYVGEPQPLDPKSKQPTEKAHLAHVEMFLPTQEAFDGMWAKTATRRLNSLGGIDDQRAKAKVTFAVPIALARQLGCAP